jgi:hypothetical protein
VVTPGNAVLIGPGVATAEGEATGGEALTVAEGGTTVDSEGGATALGRPEDDVAHQSATPPAATRPTNSRGSGTFERAA